MTYDFTNISLQEIQSIKNPDKLISLEGACIYDPKSIKYPSTMLQGYVAKNTGRGLTKSTDAKIHTLSGFVCTKLDLTECSSCNDHLIIEVETNSKKYEYAKFFSILSRIFKNYSQIPLKLFLLFLNNVYSKSKVLFTVKFHTIDREDLYKLTYQPDLPETTSKDEISVTTSDNIVTFSSFNGTRAHILARLEIQNFFMSEDFNDCDAITYQLEYINTSLIGEITDVLINYLPKVHSYTLKFNKEELDVSTISKISTAISRNALVVSTDSGIQVTPTGPCCVYIVDYSKKFDEQDNIKASTFYSLDEIIQALGDTSTYKDTGLFLYLHNAPDYAKTLITHYISNLDTRGSITVIPR